MGSSKSKRQSAPSVPQKSEEELNLLRQQTALLQVQVEEARRQNEALQAIFPIQAQLLQAQTAAANQQVAIQKRSLELIEKAFEESPEQRKIREFTEEQTLAAIEGRAPKLDPNLEKLINTALQSEQQKGEREIRQYAEESAAQRGLHLSDTPVIADVARAGTNLNEALAGARAKSKLDVGQSTQIFEESVRQFQAGLQANAFQNRLALLGSNRGGGGLEFGTAAGSAFNAGVDLLSGFQRERFAGTGNRTRINEYLTTRDLLGFGTQLATGGIAGYRNAAGAGAGAPSGGGV